MKLLSLNYWNNNRRNADSFSRLPGVRCALVLFLFCTPLQAIPLARSVQPQQSSPAPPPAIPFSDYAESFLHTHRVQNLREVRSSIDALLDESYMAVRIGLFDVWYPRYRLRNKNKAREFMETASAILEMQKQWIAWTADKATKKESFRNIKTLEKWIRSWKLKQALFKKNSGKGRPVLIRLLEAKETTASASDSFAALMKKGDYLGAPEKDGTSGVSLILSPDRKDFLGLGSFIGLLNPTNRRLLLNNGLAMWTSFNRGDIHVIAMEHPATYPGRGDILKGIDMNAREETGLLQHVVQHAMDLLIEYYYDRSLPKQFASSLSMNMVIEIFEENNVRAGGGTKGRKTEAYTKFVAGGASSGGRLAARNADPRWRHTKGRDYFLAVLRTSQKEGASATLKIRGRKRNKKINFLLQSDAGGPDTHLVQAPFLVEPFAGKTVPDLFKDDYLEFLRAYRGAFLFWLMNKCKSTKEKPDELLKRLLKRASLSPDKEKGPAFGELVLDIYGRPFSGGNPCTESLEGQFLDWLSKKW